MIEVTVLNYLSEALPVPCYMEMPEDPEESFVIIEKTGGSRDNMINRANIVVQSYAGRLADAAALNDAVKEAMDGIIALDEIIRIELNSDYNYTDTAMKAYRYQAVFVITHY